jgi:hypothetical protein
MPRAEAKVIQSAMRAHTGPSVVLCSRGYSFEKRLQEVVKYAEHHKIPHVIILHCPERKYTETLVQEVTARAQSLFSTMNNLLTQKGGTPLCFELVCKKGLLEKNLASLIKEGETKMVFLGMKMLDYRPEAIKELQGTSFCFLGN